MARARSSPLRFPFFAKALHHDGDHCCRLSVWRKVVGVREEITLKIRGLWIQVAYQAHVVH